MSSLESRSNLAVRCDSIRRAIAWRFQAARVPYFLVAEYPKSGGTWLSLMLAEYMGIECPRNRSISLMRPTRSVLHGHCLYHSSYRENVVCLFRDGRDVMVSAYHHVLSLNGGMPQSRRICSRLGIDDVDDVERHLPAFIEYVFTKASLGGIRFRMANVTWRTFVYSWIDKEVPLVTYEGMLEDTVGALVKVVRRLTGEECDLDRARRVVERFSFKKQTRRDPGQENTKSFLRKGIAGDWKNCFTKEARECFDHYAGDALIAAGYERDHSWVSRVDESLVRQGAA